MKVRPVFVDAGEAMELAELLEFLRCWLDGEDEGVAGSFRRFVGDASYDTGELRADLSRFAFLLGSGDGELLPGGGGR